MHPHPPGTHECFQRLLPGVQAEFDWRVPRRDKTKLASVVTSPFTGMVRIFYTHKHGPAISLALDM